MIREALFAVARNESIGGLLSRAPLARTVVNRVVGGDNLDDALAVASALADRGLWVSLERSAPTLESDEGADGILGEYLELVDRVAGLGLAGVCEVSAFPESFGLSDGDAASALLRMTSLCEHATAAGIAVVIGMGPPEHVGRTIDWADRLQARDLAVGVTLQACLRRTEADCHRFADRRVRLVKGAYRGDPDVAHDQPLEVDKAFVRCAKTLLGGRGTPSFATHDPRLIDILESLAERYQRAPQSFEFAFYMGRQEGAQDRLAEKGDRVRVYVPYGPDWFERLMGGLAEQPTSIAAAVRSLLPGSST